MVMSEPTPIAWDKIAIANTDLNERLFESGVRLDYDEDGDTLFLTIGEGGPSISKEAFDDLFIRVDPTTYQIVGCTIVAFASDLLAKNKLIRKMFPGALEALRAAGGTIQWHGRQAERTKPLFDAALVH